MSNDSFTTTTRKSWFGRIGDAVGGVVFGLILFLGAFVLLSWNEGRTIAREKTLKTGASDVVSLTEAVPDAANEGRLVHVSAEATADAPLEDSIFGITEEALRLRRSVEMFQWKEDQKSETKQNLGGSEETVTTYSYSKTWSPTLIDSSSFQKPDGHQNPGEFPVDSVTLDADPVTLGGFVLPTSLVDQINNFATRPVTRDEAAQASARHDEEMSVTTAGALFIGADPGNPAIGDVRVTFSAAPAGPVSVIARQIGDSFEPYSVRDLGTIELLRTGTVGAGEMFRMEQEGNRMLAWILRLVGFFMMFFGVSLMLGVFSVVASVVPLFGRIAGAGTSLVALVVSLPLTLLTIALAWLAFRPLIGIPVAVLAVAAVVFGIRLLAGRLKKPATNPATTPAS